MLRTRLCYPVKSRSRPVGVQDADRHSTPGLPSLVHERARMDRGIEFHGPETLQSDSVVGGEEHGLHPEMVGEPFRLTTWLFRPRFRGRGRRIATSLPLPPSTCGSLVENTSKVWFALWPSVHQIPSPVPKYCAKQGVPPIDSDQTEWDYPTMIVTLDSKRRLTVAAALAPASPGDCFDARFDADEDVIILRRIKRKANWLEVWKKCPAPMDDLPPRSRELPRKVKL